MEIRRGQFAAGTGETDRFPGQPDAEVLLPLRRDWPDYSRRMADAVLTLAAVEQRPYEEVLQDLSSVSGDVLRVCVQTPDAALGTLPLDEGLQLLSGGRDMLLAAHGSAHLTPGVLPAAKFCSRVGIRERLPHWTE